MTMSTSANEIAQAPIDRGHALLNQLYKPIPFTKSEEANAILNNLTDFPHAFVLACVMNRQIQAEKAWLIPYPVKQRYGLLDLPNLCKLSLAFVE